MPLLRAQGLEDGAPLPPWLVDQRYMCPLLVAYDARLASLEADVGDKVRLCDCESK